MARDVDDVATCFVCGCRDDVACPGGCSWSDDLEADGLDVCSSCVELRDLLVDLGRPVSLEQLSEWKPAQRDQAFEWGIAKEAEGQPGGVPVPPEPVWVGGLGG